MKIGGIDISMYEIPTRTPESDGTLEWRKTTMVIVELHADGKTGVGYTYADHGTPGLIRSTLVQQIVGYDPFAIPAAHARMITAIRNYGRPGISSMAISAVDAALWDLKAKIVGLPLVQLLGAERDAVPIYGSGGFTSYTIPELEAQLGSWVADGIPRVKMKVGRFPDDDDERVRAARTAIGAAAELYVDANGAYCVKQALAHSELFSEYGVTWFEEPVSSDDLDGLRLMRHRACPGMDITAGEYGFDIYYFRRMLEAQSVDCLQIDASRCGGITGFLAAAALAASHNLDISAHCCPTLHLPVCLAAPRVRHMEYFFDHVRIEDMFFDGVRVPQHGGLTADLGRPGFGVELKRKDIEKYRVG